MGFWRERRGGGGGDFIDEGGFWIDLRVMWNFDFFKFKDVVLIGVVLYVYEFLSGFLNILLSFVKYV